MIFVELLRIIDRFHNLISVKYGDKDETEFSLLFTQWSDTEYLFDFFQENKSDLKSHYSINSAVLEVLEDAAQTENYILDSAKSGNADFLTKFIPLHTGDDEEKPMLHCKMYGSRPNSMLRIYGIKLANKAVIITGGAIKLTRTMQERAHTKLELQKMKQVARYLINEGFTTEQIEFLDIEL